MSPLLSLFSLKSTKSLLRHGDVSLSLSLWFKIIETHQCNIETLNAHYDAFPGSFSSR